MTGFSFSPGEPPEFLTGEQNCSTHTTIDGGAYQRRECQFIIIIDEREKCNNAQRKQQNQGLALHSCVGNVSGHVSDTFYGAGFASTMA